MLVINDVLSNLVGAAFFFTGPFVRLLTGCFR